jgi:hypothetical protein
MSRFAIVRTGVLSLLLGGVPWLQPLAVAQPPASNPHEMCGDGTTFTVNLPGLAGSLPFGIPATDDAVTLPKGCRIYALFVSGYSVNPRLDHLSFYKLAQFVAANDGYVHYAWWNNLFGEYLSRPLHGGALPVTVSLPPLGAVSVQLTPGDLFNTHAAGFVPADIDSPMPKAIPAEDTQFQQDAKLLLEAVRSHNPDALIIVGGHSMGGNAVARLGTDTTTLIDLLAPIDPVGNRNNPRGTPGTKYYNWTRWRVANNLLGYRQLDCERNALGLCEDKDPRLFHVSYHCFVTPMTTTPPLLGSKAPLACPRLEPIIVTGPRPRIGSKVRFLYHRWQKEFVFPFDFGADERLDRGPLTGLLGGNYQAPLLKNAIGESDRNKSCGLSGSINFALLVAQALLPGFVLPSPGAQPNDPRDPGLLCNPFDGHGEIVGMRGRPGLGLAATNRWPCYTALLDPSDNCSADDSIALRRQKLVEMALAPAPDDQKVVGDTANWVHEPENPNLDYVVDDMLIIVRHLMTLQPAEADVTAPVTEASVSPEASSNGWHMDELRVRLAASDAGGSGVKEIERSASGATTLPGIVTTGDVVEQIVNTEGTTTLTFRARDLAGNSEAAQSLDVRIDRTPPQLSTETDRAPNGHGWFNGPVTVRFVAVDALSGLFESSPDQTVATEGVSQEATGIATDLAGNQTSATAILNIDSTRPTIAIASPGDGSVHLLNAPVLASYSCGDALSGVDMCVGPTEDGGALETSFPGTHVLSVRAMDRAGNVTAASAGYSVRYAFSGYHRPVGDATAAKAGQNVPVKYSLADAFGTAIDNLQSFVSLGSAPASCDGAVFGPWETAAAADSQGLRYDRDSAEFHFNWRTDRQWRGSCRVLRLELNDGSSHLTLFRMF